MVAFKIPAARKIEIETTDGLRVFPIPSAAMVDHLAEISGEMQKSTGMASMLEKVDECIASITDKEMLDGLDIHQRFELFRFLSAEIASIINIDGGAGGGSDSVGESAPLEERV